MSTNKEDSSLLRKIDILSAQQGYKEFYSESDSTKRVKAINESRNYLLNHPSEVGKRWKEHESNTANHWGRMATWTRLDITLLSLGINHQYFRSDLLSGIFGGQIINPTILDSEYYDRYLGILSQYFGSDIEREFFYRWQIIKSKYDIGAISTTAIIDWAKATNFNFFPKLVKVVLKCNPERVDWKAKYIEVHSQLEQAKKRGDELSLLCEELQKYKTKALHTKEKESMLKIIVVMALGGYGYTPNTKKSLTVGSIHEDALKCGISINEDTIRKYLKEGAALISQDIIEYRKEKQN